MMALTLTLLALAAAAAEPRSCQIRDAGSRDGVGLYLLCEQGGLLVSTPRGPWEVRDTGATTPLRALAVHGASGLIAVGDGGLILASGDDGRTWTKRTSGTADRLTSIHFTGEAGWIAGFNGVILHSDDGGRTWQRQPSGVTQTLEDIHFAGAELGWAVGWVGLILRTTDGGKTWQQVKTPAATWSLNAVRFLDAKTGWAVGFNGQILRSRDGGVTWEALPSAVKSTFYALLFDGSGGGWIAAEDSLLASRDGGSTWQPVPMEDSYFLSRLVATRGGILAVGPFGVLRLGTGAPVWQPVDRMLAPPQAAPAAAPSTANSNLE